MNCLFAPHERYFWDIYNNDIILFRVKPKGHRYVALIKLESVDEDYLDIKTIPYSDFDRCIINYRTCKDKHKNETWTQLYVNSNCSCKNPNYFTCRIVYKNGILYQLEMSTYQVTRLTYLGPKIGHHDDTKIVEKVKAQIFTDEFMKKFRASLLQDVIDMLQARDEEFGTKDAQEIKKV